MTANKPFNIIIAGVGGQGVITLTQIIAEAALIQGLDVKTSELHGLSQRGGSVETSIKIGKKVYSPLVARGAADLILGQEITEALRKIYYANSKTLLLANRLSVSYPNSPSEKRVVGELKRIFKRKGRIIEASKICKEELGKEVLSGVFLLSFAAHNKMLPLKPNSILKAINSFVPKKYLDINQKAFKLAKDYK